MLVREPELSRLPPDLNPRLTELVRRCLEKHPKRRWQAIGDVRAELEAIAAAPATPSCARSRNGAASAVAPCPTCGVSALIVGAAPRRRVAPKPELPAARRPILDRDANGPAVRRLVAISPDG